MGLIVLMICGSLTGWLASIITRTEDRRGILLYCGAGLAASVIVGMVTNQGSVLLGVSWESLGAALAGSILALAALGYWRMRSSNGES